MTTVKVKRRTSSNGKIGLIATYEDHVYGVLEITEELALESLKEMITLNGVDVNQLSFDIKH